MSNTASDKVYVGTGAAMEVASRYKAHTLTPRELELIKKVIFLLELYDTDEVAAALLIALYMLGERILEAEQ